MVDSTVELQLWMLYYEEENYRKNPTKHTTTLVEEKQQKMNSDRITCHTGSLVEMQLSLFYRISRFVPWLFTCLPSKTNHRTMEEREVYTYYNSYMVLLSWNLNNTATRNEKYNVNCNLNYFIVPLWVLVNLTVGFFCQLI